MLLLQDHYYIKDFMPDISYSPILIPSGRWKIIGNITREGTMLAHGEYFVRTKRIGF